MSVNGHHHPSGQVHVEAQLDENFDYRCTCNWFLAHLDEEDVIGRTCPKCDARVQIDLRIRREKLSLIKQIADTQSVMARTQEGLLTQTRDLLTALAAV